MKNIIHILATAVRSLFGGGKDRLTRSKLVGMYMSRTNHNNSLSIEMQNTRQRRNGKYAIHRERF
ncbi:MAG: hypothetical protein P8L18_06555 [Verrucomicrobiota bacterium]|nr:hypothetical protein [Verrucomicrobiota bacterium]